MIQFIRIVLAGWAPERDDERGASAVEYGLLVAGIAALIVAVVLAFGGVIKETFSDTCTQVNTSTIDASC